MPGVFRARKETSDMADHAPAPYRKLYAEIKETLLSSRNQAYSAVNFAKEALINPASAPTGKFPPALRCKSLKYTKYSRTFAP